MTTSGTTRKRLENRGITRRSLLNGLLGGAVVTLGLPALKVFLNERGTALAGDGSGDSDYCARHGLVDKDPPLQRRDLGRRLPERGDRVLEAVMGLLRERPIGSIEKHVVRSL